MPILFAFYLKLRSEAYSEPYQTSKMELFLGTFFSAAVNYFCKNTSSYMFMVLNTPLKILEK